MSPTAYRATLPSKFVGHALYAALLLCAPLPAGAETLADAVAAAYDRNPQLVQQRYLQKARDENYVQARSQYGPTVTASTSGGYSYQKTSGPFGSASDGTSQTTSVTVSQPLYTSGRLRGQLEAAKAGVFGGREELRLVEQQVVQNVVQVYASVLRDEARVEIARENVAVLRSQLQQNRKRQQVGDVTLTDVSQSDARLAAAEIQLAGLEAQLAVSRGQYLEVVGHNPGNLDPLPQLGGLPPSLDQAFDLASQNNPSLRVAQYTEVQSSANAAAARGEGGPTISLSAQGKYSNDLFQVGGNLEQKQGIAGFTISQPLFSAGAVRSRVREADARNRADQAGIDIARRTALQAVTTAWVDLSSARIAVTKGEQQVESAQQAFAGMSCEELNGLRSTIETLNAEQELQAAQLQLMQSRYQVYVAHAALLAAVGDLSADRIAQGISVYDPEANFKRVRYSGMTPLELVAQGVDRIGSAAPHAHLSYDLSGMNVPHPEDSGPLATAPTASQLNRKMTPITESQLKLPNGDTGRCPLNDVRRR